MARAMADGWPEQMVKWLNAEKNRPRAHYADVTLALALLQVQVFASAAAASEETSDKNITRLYCELAQREIPVHIAKVRDQLKREGYLP